jgi:phosphate/sulfate permease
MKKNFLFFLGILTFSFVIGLMTGASNSPVAGSVIGSIFGIGIALLGLLTNKDVEIKIKLNLIGCGFITLSIGLMLGLYSGVNFRYKDQIASEDKRFIWDKTKAPRSTYEAMDWILTNDLLISRGFSRQQVQSIYAIRLNEVMISDSTKTIDIYGDKDKYSKEFPYYKMIIGGYENNLLNRSIASPQESNKDKSF